MKRYEYIQSFKVATVFLGTIIGAGFATGQEIIKFFTGYGIDGYLGIMLATILFIAFGVLIFSISHAAQKYSYHDFFYFTFGKWIGLVADVLITIFLFGIFNIMISASGALFNQYFGLDYYIGGLFTLFIVYIVVLKGIKGILNTNFYLVPIIIFLMSIISVVSILSYSNGSIIRNLYFENSYDWIISSLLYVSYNIIMASPILVPLCQNINDKSILYRGMFIGGCLAGVLILLINSALLNNYEENVNFQIPLLHVIEPFSVSLKFAFVIILWIAIFTTILSNIFGLINRLEDILKIERKLLTLIICITSLFISRFDFKTLLSTLYPFFGMVSLIFIVIMIIKYLIFLIKSKIFLIKVNK